LGASLRISHTRGKRESIKRLELPSDAARYGLCWKKTKPEAGKKSRVQCTGTQRRCGVNTETAKLLLNKGSLDLVKKTIKNRRLEG